MAYLHTLYYTNNFPILMDLSASKNISMTLQGYVEEWNSKFPHFKFSIPCLVYTLISFTSQLMSPNFILLPFTAHTAKKFPPDKATERFCICPVTSESLLGYFNGFYRYTKIFIYELMQFMWLATSWQLCLLCGTVVKSRAQWKQAKNLDHGMSFLEEGECRSMLAKPAG